MFERYTERARRTIFFARYEAAQAHSSAIEIEHLLLGVLREGKGLVSQLLRRRDISLADLQKQLTQVGSGPQVPASVDIPLATTAQRALLHAGEESERTRDTSIGVEHILLGILRAKETRAAEILAAAGLTLEQARQDLAELVTPESTVAADSPPALEKLVRFLMRLEQAGHRYHLSHPSPDGIRVEVARRDERWEIDFGTTGSVEVRVFQRQPVVEGEKALERLFEGDN